MKMFEMKKYLIILMAILIILAFFSIYLTSPTGFIISIFSKPPEIINASVDPIKVEPSDYMIIRAEIKDEYGIENVKADMAGIEIINLSLVEGNATHGVYQATWFVHSVEVGKTYNATIITRNVKGKESFVRVEFHDDPVFCCRREINGTGPIINDASYISFTLNTSYLISQGKMRSDCGDIRFTDSRSFDSALWTRNFSYNIQGCWLQGFSYRKPITITNIQNSNNLTDYQVLVTLDTASLISQGKMRSDFGDIRFTDSDGSTLLNYWIENHTGVLYVGYDDGAKCYLNGNLVFDAITEAHGVSFWNKIVDVSPYLVDGENLLACWVANGGENNGTSAGGLDLKLVVDGQVIIPQSDDDSNTSTKDSNCAANPIFKYYYCAHPCQPSNWYNVSFDDSSWSSGNGPFAPTSSWGCTNALTTAPDDLFVRKKFNITTRIWVKVPLIPANSMKMIYVYYGNPSASSMSNGDATFDFFDDFLGTSLNTSKWVAYSNNYSVSNSILRINNGGIERTSAFDFRIQDGYMAEVKVKHEVLASNYGGVLPEVASSPYTASGNANADATILYMRNNGVETVYYWIGDGSNGSYNIASAVSTGWNAATGNWYITGISVNGGTVKLWRDGNTIITRTGINWAKDLRYVKLGTFNRNDTYDLQDTSYDWIRVRKYASPEPTTSVWGEETENSTETSFSVQLPSGVTSFFAYYGNPQVTSISNSSIIGFSYRKPITITNIQNSNNLTDYQVLVNLDTASLISQGKMRSDFGDIRFTDSDGSTLLNYWIENHTGVLYVGYDDGAKCYLNGNLVFDAITEAHVVSFWNKIVDVSPYLVDGENLLACWVANGGENSGTSAGGLDLKLVVDGQVIIPQSDDDSNTSTKDSNCAANPIFKYYYCAHPCQPSNWYNVSFDDSSWSSGNGPFAPTSSWGCTNALTTAPDDLFVRKKFNITTRIWVKVPLIPANSMKTIYVYYGNPSASSASNGVNTFVFFDDFESYVADTDINNQGGWITKRVGGTGEAKVRLANGRKHLHLTSTDSATAVVHPVSTSNSGYAIRLYEFADDWDEAFSMAFSDDQITTYGNVYNGYEIVWWGWSGITSKIRKWVNGASTDLASISDSDSNNVYHTLEFIWYGSTLKAIRDGVEKLSATDTTYSSRTYIHLDEWNGSSRYIDWVLVRKYASPEPTTSVGVEEPVTLGPEETWIRISGGGGSLLITGGSGGGLRIK